MDLKKLKENTILFFSLERYAFLILGLQIICGFLELLNIKYISCPYTLIYAIPHIIIGIYFLIRLTYT